MATSISHPRLEYDPVARALHWLVAALVLGQFVIGWTMPDVGRDTRPVGLIAWHLGLGAALVLVMAARLLWRLLHEPPRHNGSPLMRTAAKFTHALLYGALFIVPLLGWTNASSRGWIVKAAGVLPLPALSATGSPVGHVMGDVHGVLAWGLFALIALHLGAVCFHRFVLKDDLLKRMR